MSEGPDLFSLRLLWQQQRADVWCKQAVYNVFSFTPLSSVLNKFREGV